MKAVPVDVMRDVAQKICNLKAEEMKLKRESRESIIIADRLELERDDLERFLEKWQNCFPETIQEY